MRRFSLGCTALLLVACKSGGGDGVTPPPPAPTTYTLTVTVSGAGSSASVTSTPAGISCTLTDGTQGGACAATFPTGTAVTLASTATTGSLSAWGSACSGSGSCVVTVNAATTVTATYTLPPVAISTTSLGSGTVGTAYSGQLVGTGGNTTYTWSLSTGSLPAGLTLNTTSGAITGTPTGAGTSNFTVQLASNGTTATRALSIVITSPVAGRMFGRLATGETSSCAIVDAPNGTLYCWGGNASGELGLGSADLIGRAEPTLVPMPGGVTVRDVSVGGGHACAIATNGDVYCWGRNNGGQIGNGGRSQMVMSPVLVSQGVAYSQISAGSGLTCGVSTTNIARCWGSNARGQIGDSTIDDRLTPTLVSRGRKFITVSAGSSHACGLEYDGSNPTGGMINCWGRADDGQIGDGVVRSFVSYPVRVDSLTTYGRIAAGPITRHTCAASGGRIRCWGANNNGQLGDGTTVPHSTPQLIQTSLQFNEVSAWGDHTCGSDLSGKVQCWGLNISGELGDGTSSSRTVPTPAVLGSQTIRGVTIGNRHTCAIGATLATSSVICWGYNGEGQLGTGSFQPPFTTAPGTPVKAP